MQLYNLLQDKQKQKWRKPGEGENWRKSSAETWPPAASSTLWALNGT